MLLAIHFARLGPYHLARLRSASDVLVPLGWRVAALEIAGSDSTYEWEREPDGWEQWERVTVFPDGVFENIPAVKIKSGIVRELDRLRPDAVAIAGWGTVDARACLDWCKRNDARAIVMSETRAADAPRAWWKELVKYLIVNSFDAAICGGESHKRYLMQLGMPKERIALGYNVVDNNFFKFSAPDCEPFIDGSYFLASNRFVERKNLRRLLEGYKIFQDIVLRSLGLKKEDLWPLVLLGDGKLRGALQATCVELGLKTLRIPFSGVSDEAGKQALYRDKLNLNTCKKEALNVCGGVVFAGFRQIWELPTFYAGAGAFVHPALQEPWGLVINEAMASGLPVLSSRNVGAAEELVQEGKTGFLFDPMDVKSIAESLLKIFLMSEPDRRKMGGEAREMVERKVPSRAFGEGLAKVLGT